MKTQHRQLVAIATGAVAAGVFLTLLASKPLVACEIGPADVRMTTEQYARTIALSESEGHDGCVVGRGISRILAMIDAASDVERDRSVQMPPELVGRSSACNVTANQLGLSPRGFQAFLLASQRAGFDECTTMSLLLTLRAAKNAPSTTTTLRGTGPKEVPLCSGRMTRDGCQPK